MQAGRSWVATRWARGVGARVLWARGVGARVLWARRARGFAGRREQGAAGAEPSLGAGPRGQGQAGRRGKRGVRGRCAGGANRWETGVQVGRRRGVQAGKGGGRGGGKGAPGGSLLKGAAPGELAVRGHPWVLGEGKGAVWGWVQERDSVPSVRSARFWGAGRRWVLLGGQGSGGEGRGSHRGSGVQRREGCVLGLGSLGRGGGSGQDGGMVPGSLRLTTLGCASTPNTATLNTVAPSVTTPNTATPTGAGTKWEKSLCNRRDVQPCPELLVQNLAGSCAELLSLCQAVPAGREMLWKWVWDWRDAF